MVIFICRDVDILYTMIGINHLTVIPTNAEQSEESSDESEEEEE